MLVSISLAAVCTDVTISNCFFQMPAGPTNAILCVGGAADLHVIGNVAIGNFSGGCLLASAATSLRVVITDNIFVNLSSAVGIALNASTNGVLARNMLKGATSIAATLTGEDAMACFENYITGAVAASGLLDPAADAD